MINGNSNVLYLLYIFNGIPCIFIHFKIVLSIFSFEKEKSTYFKNVFENLLLLFVNKENIFLRIELYII